ncbi:MAG: hypothetical protein JW993_08925 [Sedimentisphaerales bacterium]|nr:hypothetical protein [Sedimentisphaerales bacterium]
MAHDGHNAGTVLPMVIFAVALLAALVIGMLEMNTEEIQIVRNHVEAAKALGVAEAGLNNALAELRIDRNWNDGFSGKSFPGGGQYSVVVEGSEITATGTSVGGFMATVEAQVLISASGPPYAVSVQSLKVNE